MATSARIKLFKPLNIWLAVNAVVLLLFLSAISTIEDVSRLETRRLVKMQVETLVRARIHDLELRNYRLFVEGVGRDLIDTFIEVKTQDGNFSYGKRIADNCEEVVVPLVGTTAVVNLCKASNFAYRGFFLLIAAYAIVSLIVWLLLSRLERRSTSLLIGFFRSLGVDVDPAGGVLGLLGQVKEILLALDEAKRQEVKLMRDAVLVETAKQVAHDIRTPLAVLKTAMDLKNTKDDGERSSILALNALARIDAIASDLLNKGRGEAALRELKMSLLINEIVESQNFSRTGSQVTMTVSIAEHSVDTMVCIEPLLFTRLLNNLINNAYEAISGAGRIDVSLCVSEREVEIALQDSGHGIEPDLLSRLMAKQVSFGKEKGNGLGLYHARKCVEDWGGTIKIESEVAKGTKVKLTLPTVSSYKATASMQAGVILIDDDIWIREAWILAGKQVGVQVTTFAKLEELLQVSSEISFNVRIYVDYELVNDRGDRVGEVLYALGYRNLHLATGHDPADLVSLPFFKSVGGKDPPF